MYQRLVLWVCISLSLTFFDHGTNPYIGGTRAGLGLALMERFENSENERGDLRPSGAVLGVKQWPARGPLPTCGLPSHLRPK